MTQPLHRTAMLIKNYELKIRNGEFVIRNSRFVIKVAGEFIRWSCRFAPAPSGETVPVWAGCTQSAHPSHTRTEAKK